MSKRVSKRDLWISPEEKSDIESCINGISPEDVRKILDTELSEENKMTPENFCYWLQGYIEIKDPRYIDEQQLRVIKEHLDLVFNKVTTPDTNIDNSASPKFNPLPPNVHFPTLDCSDEPPASC